MATYLALTSESGLNRRPRIIKQGFRLSAFLFGPFWAFAVGEWLLLALTVTVLAAILMLHILLGLDALTSMILIFLSHLWLGMNAADWMLWRALRRRQTAIRVSAPDAHGAAMQAAQKLRSQTPPAAPRPAGTGRDAVDWLAD